MDYIESLAKQASQITMYDVKSYYNQAKNMVLNLSEMEAKVAEATNDDPWGASSTLMQEIADGTHNFAQFNEIMPTIYSRFMEKEAREWRQIYKALTLLEFLVKNGSERVVDDARAHVSTIKMLRSFHYVDEKGKDQGINVRNRSSEIALLLADVEKIRQERRKAKANKSKYQGTGNDGGMSFVTSGGSRYGGFGSETLGSSRGGGGGEGSGGYGGSSGYENDHYRPSRSSGSGRGAPAEYDEYEGADDFEDDQPPRRAPSSSSNRRPNPPPKNEPRKKETLKAPEPPAQKPKEVNLFDFDDDEAAPAPAPATATSAPVASANILGGDDDFDDFQSGPSTSPPPPFASAALKAQNGANANLFDLLNSSTPSVPAPQAQAAPKAPSFSQPSYQSQQSFNLAQPVQPAMTSRPSYTSTASQSTTSAVSPKPTGASASSGGLGGFDDLWNTSLSSAGVKAAQKPSGGKTMSDLDREKAMGSLWGKTQQQQAGGAAKPSGGSGFDDLLM